MSLKRLFIGLSFSNKFANDLEPWIKKIKKTADKKETDLSWTPPDNYHVTLVFLGQTEESEIASITEKMQAVAEKHAPFKLKLRGLDGFPSLMQARVLYLDVQRSQNILNLQGDLEQALQAVDRHEAGYVPHLTIARLRNPKSCRDLVSPFVHIDLGKQEVCEIVLFSSQMNGNFVSYEKIKQIQLGGNESLGWAQIQQP
ncbi:MAG: RNA 2',3'-cyclic phosphodiesterase [Bdellovibrionaceae bacterium]|nr:RNA 2',3'-cyclic phosphodiesterase [Bdellovibrio sp.]